MKMKVTIRFRAETIPGEAATILVPTNCGPDVAEVVDGGIYDQRKIRVDVNLDESDERVEKVLALLRQHNVEVDLSTYPEYSDEDLQNARLLLVAPSVSEADVTLAAWNGTKYDLKDACPNCQAGAKQSSPAYLDTYDKKAIQKHRAVLVSYHSLIVDGGMRKKLVDAGVTGISFGDVRMRLDNNKWSEVARDQVFATHTLPPMRGDRKPKDEKQVCKVCRRSGWYRLADTPYREEDLVDVHDFNLTWEWFGEFSPQDKEKNRPATRSKPHLLVTPKVMNIFREAGVKAFDWWPVNVAP